MKQLSNILNRIEKKHRYVAFALIMGIYIYVVSVFYSNTFFITRLVIGLVIIIISVFVVHYPNIHIKNFIMSLVMPTHLLAGILLSLKYYPNLGDIFRLIVIGGVVFMFYIIALVDNIFFVVEDREEAIPLYRVALTWSQILMVTLTIPLYAGIYKVPVNVLIQSTIVGLSAFTFNLYQLWVLRHEERIVPVRIGSGILFSLLPAFYVLAVSFGVAFIPAEAFLRGLLVSATLLFGLVYIAGHLKNEITKELLIEYFAIIIIFLTILLYFKP